MTRHQFPPIADEMLSLSETSTLKAVDRLERSPRSFGMALSSALRTVEAHCAGDPAANELETWEAVVTAAQIGSALFAASDAPAGEVVECRIAHKIRHIPAAGGAQHFTDAGTWLTAFWLAVVCREQERMSQLCGIPVDLLRSSGADYDEYIYYWVVALQAYWLERSDFVDQLIRAIEASHPDRAPGTPRDLLQDILYPPINLLYHFFRGNHEGYNQSLVEALEQHKRYWTANDERAGSLTGAIALAPLAITCLAHDAGRPIDVESEYLPEHLIKRSWVGEFPT